MGVATVLKKSLISGFLSLPVLFLSYIGFLSIGLASTNLFLLFIGCVTVLPIVVFSLHWFHGILKAPFAGLLGAGLITAYYTVPSIGNPNANTLYSTTALVQTIFTVLGLAINTFSNEAREIQSFGLTSGQPERQNVSPSFWSAIVVFIMGYMFSSALNIYNMPAATGAADSKVANRKGKAFMIMMNLLLILIMLLGLRYSLGTETLSGLGVSLFVIAPLAVLWNEITTLCGAAPGDIFGIVQRMLPSTASADVPKVCIYTK